MARTYGAGDVTIREVAPVRVAVLEHRGDPATVAATIRRLIAWRIGRGLSPAVSTTFNVFHTDPRTTLPAEYRIDLCVGTEQSIETGDELVAGMIPGGRCAVIRVVGSGDIAAAALYLCREWLPASGQKQRDFPLYCQRLTFFPDGSEDDAVTELFLPLK